MVLSLKKNVYVYVRTVEIKNLKFVLKSVF